MSTRRMTRETRVEWRFYDLDGNPSPWRPIDGAAWMPEWVESGQFPTRTVERMVTEWTEVTE